MAQTGMNYAAAAAALGAIARKATTAASWRETVFALTSPEDAFQRKTPADQSRDLLLGARIMRDAGALDADVAFFMVGWTILSIADDQVANHPELRRLSAEMDAIEQAEGVAGDEYWPTGEGPDEYESLRVEWECAHDRATADVFRDYDEPEMALLYEHDNKAFHRRYHRGRTKLFGPLPDDVAAVLRDKGMID